MFGLGWMVLSCTPVRLNNKVVMLNRVSAFAAVMHSAPWMVLPRSPKKSRTFTHVFLNRVFCINVNGNGLKVRVFQH